MAYPSQWYIARPCQCNFSEAQHLENSVVASMEGCTKLSVIMHQFVNFFQICPPDICANNFSTGSCWSEKLHTSLQSFVIWKWETSSFCILSCFRPPNWGQVGGLILVSSHFPIIQFIERHLLYPSEALNSCQFKFNQYLRPIIHKLVQHSGKTLIVSEG